MRIAVAIDGPAGAGKSTIAKLVGKKFDLMYINTGAMYRAVALSAKRNNIKTTEIDSLMNMIDKMEMHFENDDLILNGVNIQDEITLPEISEIVSQYASIPEVRSKLVVLQRKMSEKYNVIMDGRDIGTVVLPHAQVKIFLTASAEERARRRCLELEQKGEKVSYEEVLADIQQRDYQDSHRAIAPLVPAQDAEIVDTSDCGLEEAVERILQIVYKKLPKSPVDFSGLSGI